MDNNNKPILYSKTAIILFSFVASFISGLLYVANLKTLGRNKYVILMSLYALFASAICINILKSAGIPLMYSYLPVNFICGFLLTNVFWNYQIETNDYKKRSVRNPLLITVGIIIFLMIFTFLLNPRYKTKYKSVTKDMGFISAKSWNKNEMIY